MKQDDTTIRVVKIVSLLVVMATMGRILTTFDAARPTQKNACPACGGLGMSVSPIGLGIQPMPGACRQCGGAGE